MCHSYTLAAIIIVINSRQWKTGYIYNMQTAPVFRYMNQSLMQQKEKRNSGQYINLDIVLKRRAVELIKYNP